MPFGVGRGSDSWGFISLQCRGPSVFIAFRRWSWFRHNGAFVIPIGPRTRVFIAFRRWSWFRLFCLLCKRVERGMGVFIAFRRWSWFRQVNGFKTPGGQWVFIAFRRWSWFRPYRVGRDAPAHKIRLHCLSALVVVPTGRVEVLPSIRAWSLHCLSALVVVPTIC